MLAPALAWSGHLRRRLDAHPDLAAWLADAVQAPVTPARLAQWQSELAGHDAPATLPVDTCRMVLRKLRERVFSALIVRDLAGQADLEEVVGAMTALAGLRAPIDAFFDKVTVNDADQQVRARRLDLLARFRDAVHRVADFGQIEG